MDTEDYTYRDALPDGLAHRRGAGLNPGNRFETVRLHVLGEELDRQWIERQENGESGPTKVERQVFYDKTHTMIMAKPDAPDLLKRELANPKWKPETIVMSAITDIYQPLEHKMQIARKC